MVRIEITTACTDMGTRRFCFPKLLFRLRIYHSHAHNFLKYRASVLPTPSRFPRCHPHDKRTCTSPLNRFFFSQSALTDCSSKLDKKSMIPSASALQTLSTLWEPIPTHKTHSFTKTELPVDLEMRRLVPFFLLDSFYDRYAWIKSHLQQYDHFSYQKQWSRSPQSCSWGEILRVSSRIAKEWNCEQLTANMCDIMVIHDVRHELITYHAPAWYYDCACRETSPGNLLRTHPSLPWITISAPPSSVFHVEAPPVLLRYPYHSSPHQEVFQYEKNCKRAMSIALIHCATD